MNRKSAVVDIICLVTKQIEHLGVHNCHDEIEGVICIGDDYEQSRFPVSECVQLHLIIAHQLTEFRDVKWGKPCAAGNQDRLGCFASRQLVFEVLLHSKVIRVTGFQLIEHDVYGIFEGLIVFSGFGGVDHFEQGSKVFLVIWCFVPDVADEGCVVQLFCLHPEILAGLIAISLRIDDDRIDQFEDVLL